MTKSKTQTAVQPAPVDPQDAEFKARQIELAQSQLASIGQQQAFQGGLFDIAAATQPGQVELLAGQLDFARRAAEQQQELDPIQQQLTDLQLQRLLEPGATPQERALIEQAASGALALGESDISRFAAQSVEQLGQELAPALGLRPEDTPIQDRAARVAEEATRQQGQLARNIRSAQAQQELGFPLQRQQITGALNLGQQQATQAAQEFQTALREQAFRNRAALTQQVGGLGLGLSGISPSFPGLAAQGTTQTVTQRPSPLETFTQIAGGAGGLLTGIGALGSSRQLKENGLPVDNEQILAKLLELPVEFWNYIGAGVDHIGTYSEDFHDAFEIGDKDTVNPIDLSGVAFAAIKALARRVEELEHGAA
ncbi:MAG: hypothetical protein GY906_24055 [bacterium]|nr:hypothetical protein [bacterium]